MKIKKIVIEAEEPVTKADEPAAVAETDVVAEAKADEVAVEAPAVEVKAEEKTEEAVVAPEVKAEDGVPAEAKVEEAVAEKPEEPVKEVADTAADVAKADDTEIVVKLDFSDFKESFEKMVSPLHENVKALTEKVDALAKAAPTEGAADAEETPTEVVETPAKAEEAPKEEVKKSDTSSEGASDSTDKILEMIKGLKEELGARLTKIESQPVPSKVVVVSKVDGEEVTELSKVTARLGEIEKMRDADPQSYMRNTTLIDEALTLVDQKRKLMGGK